MSLHARKIALALSSFGMLAAGSAGAVEVTVLHSSGSPTLASLSDTTVHAAIGSFSAASVDFPDVWHPLGVTGDFAAIVTGSLFVAADGPYTFSVTADDGVYMWLDGVDLITTGWFDHSPKSYSNAIPVTLAAGLHTFQIDYYECCGGQAELSLALPAGVTYAAAVPEPETYAMLMAGLGILGGMARRRAKA
jgi:hypothetical protein